MLRVLAISKILRPKTGRPICRTSAGSSWSMVSTTRAIKRLITVEPRMDWSAPRLTISEISESRRTPASFIKGPPTP